MKFGTTIKKIRLQKSILLKECYAGIVTKSFAIRFEKGEVNLNIEDFLSILENLSLTFEEFFFIYHEYDNSFSESVLNKMIHTHLDGQTAYRIYRKYCDDKEVDKQFIASAANFFFNLSNQTLKNFPSSQKRILCYYFEKNESWTLDEARLYPLFSILFDAPLKMLLMNRYVKIIKRYQSYSNINFENELAYGYVNYIAANLQIGDSSSGFYFLEDFRLHMKQYPLLKGDLWLCIQLDLFDAILATISNRPKEAKAKLLILKKKCEVMDLQDVADEYFRRYRQLVNRVNEQA